VIQWADNFDVLTILQWHRKVASTKAWVDSAINKGATKASAQALHCVGELIMGSYI
jgi:hypothetical protein